MKINRYIRTFQTTHFKLSLKIKDNYIDILIFF